MTRRRSGSRSAWPGPTTRPRRFPPTFPRARAASSACPGPPAPARGGRLRLQGDTQEFDNVLYLAAEAKESAAVLYVGRDAPDDPAGLSYYLNRVFEDTPRRTVKVESRSPAAPLAIEPGRSVPLIVLAAETSAGNAAFLRQFAKDGGTVLAVVTAAGKAPTLSALADAPAVDVEDSPGRGDAMLSEIAFDHPLFAPFAAPQFNDFTKIRFWKYRRIPTAPLGDVRVLARFEKGDPAVIEKARGQGPARHLGQRLEPGRQPARAFFQVHAADVGPARAARMPVPTSRPTGSSRSACRCPRGLSPSASRTGRRPGWRRGPRRSPRPTRRASTRVETAKGPREFAVNLDPLESKTAPLNVETLEQFGCRLAMSAARIENDRELMRQMQNAELEGRQKLWRPLILAVISVLIVETWLAGWLGRPRPNSRGGPSIMSRELRQALERVARRIREVRLWSSLALCWLAWALVGALLVAAGVRSIVIVGGFAALALASGLACVVFAMRSARDLRGRRPPHRGGASRPGRRPAGGRRGGPARLLGPAGLLASGRGRPGPSTTTARTTGAASSPQKAIHGARIAHLAALCGLAAVAFLLADRARSDMDRAGTPLASAAQAC